MIRTEQRQKRGAAREFFGGGPVILTVTLNAALDVTYRVPALRPGASHRVAEVLERPGGKGLNVARVLAALGHEVTVTGFVGGATGRILRERLARGTDEGDGGAGGVPLPHDALVTVAGTTRRTVAVVDDSTGETTQLNEPGPHIGPAEWQAFTARYEKLLASSSAVALCGSLPPGVPVGAYARLVRAAHAASVPVLLDTSGEPLRRGLAARPDIIKPNADELAELTGSHEPSRASQDAHRRGARAVVASLGARGMFAVTPEGRWQVTPPAGATAPGQWGRVRGAAPRGNATGAGDSAVAGLLSGLVENLSWPKRLVRAAALATATVLSAAAGEFDRRVYRELLGRVEVTEAG
jgi:tagatose 6-phosphate kinase